MAPAAIGRLSGRVVLASLPPATVAAMFAEGQLPRPSELTPRRRDALPTAA